MKRVLYAVCALALLAGGILIGVTLQRSGVFRSRSVAEPVAKTQTTTGAQAHSTTVVTEPVALGSLSTPIEMLGTVAYMPGASFTAAFAEEVEVRDVLAQPGASIARDEPVLRVTPSRSAEGRLRTARANEEAARALVEEAKTRVEARVGTKQEVIQAEQNLAVAKVQLSTLRAMLPPDDGLVRAPASGVLLPAVAAIGTVVPAGTPLFSVADTSEIAVRFGVPIGASGAIAPGTQVAVESLLDSTRPKVKTTVNRVESAAEPTSRTRPAWSAVLTDATWSVDEPVRVTSEVQCAQGLILPRSALALGEEGTVVFASRDGTAHRVPVRVLAGDAERVCVQADDLTTRDRVVTLGAHELENGSAIQEEPVP